MIPAVWHLGKNSWDTALPTFVLSGVKHCEILGIENLHLDGTLPVGVILIPGRHSTKTYGEVNACAARFARVVFCIYADEEGVYDSTELEHPDSAIWWMMPPYGRQLVDRALPTGWPLQAPGLIAQAGHPPRIYDWSFYGQVTHVRRRQCAEVMRTMRNGKLLETAGFTQGVPHDEYYRIMVQSKFVICPSGPCTVDSFRICEALEAGCIPIADDCTPDPNFPSGYWNYVFEETKLSFPVVRDWAKLPQVIDEWLYNWESNAEDCAMWWRAKKSSWIDKMKSDVRMCRP